MDFVLSFCLAFSERECKGIIYYNLFHICQRLHVLCNYHTFGKLFLPTHMLGKSSNHGRETFFHKVNFLFERNRELYLGLQDLRALHSLIGLVLPHNPELAHLPPREAELSVLRFTHAGTAVALEHFRYQTTMQTLYNHSIHAPTNGFVRTQGPDVFAQLASVLPSLIDQVHYLKQNRRTRTSRTPPQTPGQSAEHQSCSQGPAHAGCTLLFATTLHLPPRAEEAPTSDLEFKPHSSYVRNQNTRAPQVVLKLVFPSFLCSTWGKWQQLWRVGAATRIPQQRNERSVRRARRKLWRNRRGHATEQF